MEPSTLAKDPMNDESMKTASTLRSDLVSSFMDMRKSPDQLVQHAKNLLRVNVGIFFITQNEMTGLLEDVPEISIILNEENAHTDPQYRYRLEVMYEGITFRHESAKPWWQTLREDRLVSNSA